MGRRAAALTPNGDNAGALLSCAWTAGGATPRLGQVTPSLRFERDNPEKTPLAWEVEPTRVSTSYGAFGAGAAAEGEGTVRFAVPC